MARSLARRTMELDAQRVQRWMTPLARGYATEPTGVDTPDEQRAEALRSERNMYGAEFIQDVQPKTNFVNSTYAVDRTTGGKWHKDLVQRAADDVHPSLLSEDARAKNSQAEPPTPTSMGGRTGARTYILENVHITSHVQDKEGVWVKDTGDGKQE